MRFAYADPPYYLQGKKHYSKHHKEAAKWDNISAHLDLIHKLLIEYPDGWALSCNPADLRHYLVDSTMRICVWTKGFHQIRPVSVQYAWEAVILYGGRKQSKRKPMVRDWITGHPTRRKGLVGAKPDYFNDWILDLLNYQQGDELIDLFPGTNGMADAIARRKDNANV